MRYLIIGAGAAGVSAAETIRSRDARGEITILAEEAEGYYSRPGLAYLLTGEIPEEMLYPFSPDDFHRLRAHVRHARAVRILPAARQVELAGGELLPYERLLIATGSEARGSKVPGSDLAGVVNLDNVGDAREILKRARKGQSAVVVGGGITALEIVEGLRASGVTTHYFLRRDRYWSNVLEEAESKLVEARLQHEGVHIHYFTELGEIVGKPGGFLGRGRPRVVGVKTEEGRFIPCGIVAVAIGVQPRTGLAKEAGLKVDRGILVDEHLETSVPGIFAAGDVAQVYDPLTGKSLLNTLWGPAREQGQAAGHSMAGFPTPYTKKVPFNVTRLAGLTTTIIGAIGGETRDEDLMSIARGDSETFRQLPDAIAAQSGFDVNRLRVMVGENTLLGALVMGDQTLSQPLHHLITSQADITPIRSQLLDPHVKIADILIDFWAEWRKNPIPHLPPHAHLPSPPQIP